jgi:hypothetical protein
LVNMVTLVRAIRLNERRPISNRGKRFLFPDVSTPAHMPTYPCSVGTGVLFPADIEIGVKPEHPHPSSSAVTNW